MAPRLMVPSSMAGKSWWQVPEAAGHIPPAVRRHSECSLLLFVFSPSQPCQDSPPWDNAVHICGGSSFRSETFLERLDTPPEASFCGDNSSRVDDKDRPSQHLCRCDSVTDVELETLSWIVRWILNIYVIKRDKGYKITGDTE